MPVAYMVLRTEDPVVIATEAKRCFLETGRHVDFCADTLGTLQRDLLRAFQALPAAGYKVFVNPTATLLQEELRRAFAAV